jgi:hypothetical protein
MANLSTILKRDTAGRVATDGIADDAVTIAKVSPALISGATALTTLEDNDCVLVSDTSASDNRKVTIGDFMRKINNVPYLEYAWVTAPNDGGQSIPANTNTVLNLNTEIADSGNFGSISANVLTLAAGTYQFECETRLRNTSSGYFATIPLGILFALAGSGGSRRTNKVVGPALSEWSTTSGQSYSSSYVAYPELSGQFTISSSSTFSLQIITGFAAIIDSGGITATTGNDQRTTIKLWKVG